MKTEYVPQIKSAITAAFPGVPESSLTDETRFSDIPGIDSMSVVEFQIHLGNLIGDKANQVLPILDMTLAEFSEVLASL